MIPHSTTIEIRTNRDAQSAPSALPTALTSMHEMAWPLRQMFAAMLAAAHKAGLQRISTILVASITSNVLLWAGCLAGAGVAQKQGAVRVRDNN